MDVTFFQSPAKFRAWLARKHHTAAELHVGFHKTASGKGGITYPEALDEALCFGWIDGVRRAVDEHSYTIRFSPRTAKSIWSAVNIRRVGALIEAGRMRPPGLAAFKGRDASRAQRYSYENRPSELPGAHKKTFQAEAKAWAFFQAQSPSYRRTAIWWIVSAKKEATQTRRLRGLIDMSALGQRVGIVPAKTTGAAPKK